MRPRRSLNEVEVERSPFELKRRLFQTTASMPNVVPPVSLVRCALFLLLAACSVFAQEARVRLKVSSGGVLVEGALAIPRADWSFRHSYAGIGELAERIGPLSLRDSTGGEVAVRALASGEYRAARPASDFRYRVDLSRLPTPVAAAHISWLAGERGLLMLGDLLPQQIERARVEIVLPAGWRMFPAEAGRIEEVANAVFAVGADQSIVERKARGMRVSTVIFGEWSFAGQELAQHAERIVAEHARVFGGVPRERATLILLPFPKADGAPQWAAETRGATTIFIARPSFALAPLAVSLAHELFHLWVPNSLPLTGEYAWFYEGFTLYQAMRAAQRLDLLSFHDYLRALERASSAWLADDGRDSSLIEAATRRWTGQNALIYNKGMVAAFLYDLVLRQRTKNRSSLDDIYRTLFRQYHTAAPQNGNAAALETLRFGGLMSDVVTELIERPGEMKLVERLAPHGLRAEIANGRVRLLIEDQLTPAQRDLWRGLGYNPLDERGRRQRARLRKLPRED
ncbi:MAG: hypothetical protein C4334_14070 [Pyrinomonas sp.]